MVLANGKVGLEMMKAFTKLKLALKRETMGFNLADHSRRKIRSSSARKLTELFEVKVADGSALEGDGAAN